MGQPIEENKSALNEKEQERLDALLQSARRFHYLAFLFVGISFTISSLEQFNSITFPFGNITIPALQATLGLYFLSILCIIITDRLYLMALPWLRLDERRVPFAWIALTPKYLNAPSTKFWFWLPVFLCSVSTSLNLTNTQLLIPFIYLGTFCVFMPRFLYHYLQLIQQKEDERGGPITYSIYLLYWYRLIRQSFTIALFLLPVILLIPKWGTPGYTFNLGLPPSNPVFMFPIIPIFVYPVLVLIIIRLICGFPFFYRRIDRLGSRLGFPIQSEHYK